MEPIIQRINALKSYFEAHPETNHSHSSYPDTIIIDVHDLIIHDPAMAEFLMDNPAQFKQEAIAASENPLIRTLALKNVPITEETTITNIRTCNVNKLKRIKCTVKSLTSVFVTHPSITYECNSCGNAITMLQTNPKKINAPTRCVCGKKTKFKILDKTRLDTQALRVEDLVEEASITPGNIDVIITGTYLTNQEKQGLIQPGNRIMLIGIITEMLTDIRGEEAPKSTYYIDGLGIESLEQDTTPDNITVSDEQKIRARISETPLLPYLCSFIAPSIHGHEEAKKAVALQLFNGVFEKEVDGTTKRGDIHILLIGEPGTGKSRILQSVRPLLPRIRFASGGGVSGVGLLAAVIKDELTGQFAAEAGAMVLANESILCIDEFEKTSPEDRNKLHEALSLGEVTINKAGVQATMRARTSILAAANPIHGRFSNYEPMAKQLGLSPTLISRFDLIYPFTDKPDPLNDAEVANLVLGQKKIEVNKEALDFFKKHVRLGRKLKPVMTPEAAALIQQSYVKLRNLENTLDKEKSAIPITARQVGAEKRLAEAHAKARLSERVEAVDAMVAIEMMHKWLSMIGVDVETGRLDVDIIEVGLTKSKRDKYSQIIMIIRNLGKTLGSSIPVEDIIREAGSLGFDELFVEESIRRLLSEGELMEPRPGYYRPI